VTGRASELASYFRSSSMPPVSYLRQTCKENIGKPSNEIK
jgi:hypothetical protein